MAKLTETRIKAARRRERLYKLVDAHGLYLAWSPRVAVVGGACG